MSEQRLKIWSLGIRAVVEMAVIAAGVLTALAADEWNQARADRSLAVEYISRLQRDIETDIATWNFAADGLLQKIAALDRALSWVRTPDRSPLALSLFLDDLTVGSRLAYGALTTVEQTTFDELVNSGRLALVGDPDLRRSLLSYYYRVDVDRIRVNSRETGYAPTVYELIPRDPEFVVAEHLSGAAKLRIAERALERDLESLIIAERNRGRLRLEVAADRRRAASELSATLDSN